MQIQTEYAKSAYEGFVAKATKINEIFAKVAERGDEAGAERRFATVTDASSKRAQPRASLAAFCSE